MELEPQQPESNEGESAKTESSPLDELIFESLSMNALVDGLFIESPSVNALVDGLSSPMTSMNALVDGLFTGSPSMNALVDGLFTGSPSVNALVTGLSLSDEVIYGSPQVDLPVFPRSNSLTGLSPVESLMLREIWQHRVNENSRSNVVNRINFPQIVVATLLSYGLKPAFTYAILPFLDTLNESNYSGGLNIAKVV